MLNWNQGRFLRDAVESILAQSFTDWRLQIVDPGSADGSRALYEMPFIADDRRIEVLLEPDDGPSDGLNKGFSKLRCPYSYYLNADDRVIPGAFSEAVGYLKSHPSVDMVMGHGVQIDAWGHVMRRVYSDAFDPWAYVSGKAVTVQQATFFRQRVFEQAGGFNVSNKVSWDGEFVLAAGMSGASMHVLNRTWGEFRVYGGTITSDSSTRAKAQRELARMRDQYLTGNLRSGPSPIMLEARRRLAHPIRSMSILTEKFLGRLPA